MNSLVEPLIEELTTVRQEIEDAKNAKQYERLPYLRRLEQIFQDSIKCFADSED